MIKELPHMLEKIHQSDSPDVPMVFECTCGALWERMNDGISFQYSLTEGNSICELPTLYHRWEALRETMRLFSQAV